MNFFVVRLPMKIRTESLKKLPFAALMVVVGLFIAASVMGLVESWQWYRTGPLVDAANTLRQRTAPEVISLLGTPKLQWTNETLATANPSYPVPGYTRPPTMDFFRVLGYKNKDQLLYIYLDKTDRVTATFLARS